MNANNLPAAGAAGTGGRGALLPANPPRTRDQLLREATDHLALIRANPNAPRLRKRGYRRVNLKTFPYYLAYGMEGGDIVVLAFAHTAREPEYWIRRMQ